MRDSGHVRAVDAPSALVSSRREARTQKEELVGNTRGRRRGRSSSGHAHRGMLLRWCWPGRFQGFYVGNPVPVRLTFLVANVDHTALVARSSECRIELPLRRSGGFPHSRRIVAAACSERPHLHLQEQALPRGVGVLRNERKPSSHRAWPPGRTTLLHRSRGPAPSSRGWLRLPYARSIVRRRHRCGVRRRSRSSLVCPDRSVHQTLWLSAAVGDGVVDGRRPGD